MVSYQYVERMPPPGVFASALDPVGNTQPQSADDLLAMVQTPCRVPGLPAAAMRSSSCPCVPSHHGSSTESAPMQTMLQAYQSLLPFVDVPHAIMAFTSLLQVASNSCHWMPTGGFDVDPQQIIDMRRDVLLAEFQPRSGLRAEAQEFCPGVQHQELTTQLPIIDESVLPVSGWLGDCKISFDKPNEFRISDLDTSVPSDCTTVHMLEDVTPSAEDFGWQHAKHTCRVKTLALRAKSEPPLIHRTAWCDLTVNDSDDDPEDPEVVDHDGLLSDSDDDEFTISGSHTPATCGSSKAVSQSNVVFMRVPKKISTIEKDVAGARPSSFARHDALKHCGDFRIMPAGAWTSLYKPFFNKWLNEVSILEKSQLVESHIPSESSHLESDDCAPKHDIIEGPSATNLNESAPNHCDQPAFRSRPAGCLDSDGPGPVFCAFPPSGTGRPSPAGAFSPCFSDRSLVGPPAGSPDTVPRMLDHLPSKNLGALGAIGGPLRGPMHDDDDDDEPCYESDGCPVKDSTWHTKPDNATCDAVSVNADVQNAMSDSPLPQSDHHGNTYEFESNGPGTKGAALKGPNMGPNNDDDDGAACELPPHSRPAAAAADDGNAHVALEKSGDRHSNSMTSRPATRHGAPGLRHRVGPQSHVTLPGKCLLRFSTKMDFNACVAISRARNVQLKSCFASRWERDVSILFETYGTTVSEETDVAAHTAVRRSCAAAADDDDNSSAMCHVQHTQLVVDHGNVASAAACCPPSLSSGAAAAATAADSDYNRGKSNELHDMSNRCGKDAKIEVCDEPSGISTGSNSSSMDHTKPGFTNIACCDAVKDVPVDIAAEELPRQGNSCDHVQNHSCAADDDSAAAGRRRVNLVTPQHQARMQRNLSATQRLFSSCKSCKHKRRRKSSRAPVTGMVRNANGKPTTS